MRLISNNMHIWDIWSMYPRFLQKQISLSGKLSQVSLIAMLLLLHITSFIYYIMEVVRCFTCFC